MSKRPQQTELGGSGKPPSTTATHSPAPFYQLVQCTAEKHAKLAAAMITESTASRRSMALPSKMAALRVRLLHMHLWAHIQAIFNSPDSRTLVRREALAFSKLCRPRFQQSPAELPNIQTPDRCKTQIQRHVIQTTSSPARSPLAQTVVTIRVAPFDRSIQRRSLSTCTSQPPHPARARTARRLFVAGRQRVRYSSGSSDDSDNGIQGCPLVPCASPTTDLPRRRRVSPINLH